MRSVEIPGLVVNAAQVDRDGYVWVATPDTDPAGRRGGVHYAAYVVDPHAGRVHRIVRLPDEVRAVGDLVIGPEWVYLRSWRNGFSGAVGRVSRACVQDGAACGAELFTQLGNVGGSSERGFLLTANALYSSNAANSRDNRRSFDKINLAGGQITASSTYSGNWCADQGSLYVVGYFEPGVPSLVRLDKGTLAKTAQVGVSADETLIAYEGGLLYLSGYQRTRVLVRSAETLALVREFDVAAAGRVGPVFGFVAPGVLLLNGVASLDVQTGGLLLDPARGRVNLGPIPLAVRLPEGHPLAY
ncbi:MAG: hypothetical protein ACK41D_04010 [Rubricoccaceae bacterium]